MAKNNPIYYYNEEMQVIFLTGFAGQSRLNRPQVWDSGSLGSDESRKSFDLYVL